LHRPIEFDDNFTRPGYQAGSNLLGAVCLGVYRALWYLALPLAWAAAGGDRQSRRERLGGTPSEADMGGGKVRVWVHAASVGEIEGVRPVIQSFARLRPDLEFVITTMTPAGRDAARRRVNRTCQLAPFDHAATVRAFLARVRPVLVIIAETELWPNYFFQSVAAGARIALINARLSIRSMRRYRLIRPLIARVLSRADIVLAQTAEDAERFRQLGAAPERITVSGNAKYELVGDSVPLRPGLAAFTRGRPIFIAGSTGPGEEKVVLTAFGALVQRFPTLALVLAPRHLERISEVERILRETKLSYTRASEANSHAAPEQCPPKTSLGHFHEGSTCEDPVPLPDQEAPRKGSSDARCVKQDTLVSNEEKTHGHPQVLLLDTMGELGALYQHAAVAFVGGSLAPGRGGQSLAEPANASVPVLFGPHYENHRQLGDALIAAAAGRVVLDASQLVDASSLWLADEAARVAAGRRARSAMEGLAGSTAITVRYLCGLLPAS
jgi:3-deoxy-D-manno-octulosonic-acid transferase